MPTTITKAMLSAIPSGPGAAPMNRSEGVIARAAPVPTTPFRRHQEERRLGRPATLSSVARRPVGVRGASRTSSRARNALPRWLIRSFCSAVSSAIVTSQPTGTKIGS